jgi:hypothetical protein
MDDLRLFQNLYLKCVMNVHPTKQVVAGRPVCGIFLKNRLAAAL